MPGRRRAPNPAGAHFLTDRAVIAQLAAAPSAGSGDLVMDLGAGYGALTAPLARTGARVLAVERDPALAARLRRRFGDVPAVRVVEADLRDVALPRRPFFVAASPPFALTTVLCRRLLGDPRVPLAGADMILGWGAARWLAAARPRDAESAWWAARYRVRLVRRVAAGCFSPPPASDAAHVRVRPRPGGPAPAGQRLLRALVSAGYRRPDLPLPAAVAFASAGPRQATPPAVVRRIMICSAIDPRCAAVQLTADQWGLVAANLLGR